MYADDSFISITGTSIVDCLEKANFILPNHLSYLKEKGMVVNDTKTELMILPPKPW